MENTRSVLLNESLALEQRSNCLSNVRMDDTTIIFGNMKGTAEKDVRNELNCLLDKMP